MTQASRCAVCSTSQRGARTAVALAAILTLGLVLTRTPAFARAHELVRFCDSIDPMNASGLEALAGLNERARGRRVSQTSVDSGTVYALSLIHISEPTRPY